MDQVNYAPSMRTALEHLREEASKGEQSRNQLILIGSVFAVGAAMRLAGQSWGMTAAVAAVGGVILGIVVLELWERATGKRSARTIYRDPLPDAALNLFAALDHATEDQGPGWWAVGAPARESGVSWRARVRTDLVDVRPPPDDTPSMEGVAGGVGAGAVPVRGVCLPPPAGQDVIPVRVTAWLEVSVTGQDPEGTAAESDGGALQAAGADLLAAFEAAAGVSLPGGKRRRPIAQAFDFNAPFRHRLAWSGDGLTVVLPYTKVCDARRVKRLVDGLLALRRARLRGAPSSS